MFFFRNRIAFSALLTIVIGAIKVALDVVYKVLKVLKLQFLVGVLFVGAVLFIFNVIPENTSVFIIFIAFAVLGLFVFIFGNLHRVTKVINKIEKERAKNDEEKEKEKNIENLIERKFDELKDGSKEEPKREEIYQQPAEIKKEKFPKYFSVKGQKNFVMAEYEDRFVLYRRENGKLYKVRVDSKER